MKFGIESIKNIMPEIIPLAKLHAKEVDIFSHALDVDWNEYIQSQADHNYIFFTVRDKGELVGYAGYFGYFHLHHRNKIHAKLDVIFIEKQNRGIGTRFIRYCESHLKKTGVNIISMGVPENPKWGMLLDRMGYDKIEVVYAKELQ